MNSNTVKTTLKRTIEDTSEEHSRQCKMFKSEPFVEAVDDPMSEEFVEVDFDSPMSEPFDANVDDPSLCFKHVHNAGFGSLVIKGTRCHFYKHPDLPETRKVIFAIADGNNYNFEIPKELYNYLQNHFIKNNPEYALIGKVFAD